MIRRTYHRTAIVNGRTVFYREAGDPAAPTLLLLHGLPTSSRMFRDLMPALADRFHLVAPDYIGFGHSEAPPRAEFDYTFDNLAAHVAGLVDVLGLTSYILYMQDYGGPVGFRLFTQRPDRVAGLVIQNTNAYLDGVGEPPKRALPGLWEKRTPETERPVDRQGTKDYRVDLLENYKANLALYPAWQAAFRTHRPKTLIVWGKNDPFFIPPGARAYLNDLPDAKLVWLDAGHLVLDENTPRVAAEINAMFGAC